MYEEGEEEGAAEEGCWSLSRLCDSAMGKSLKREGGGTKAMAD